MRIGLISTFPPRHCGVGDYTYELVSYLSKAGKGSEVFVNTFDDQDVQPADRIKLAPVLNQDNLTSMSPNSFQIDSHELASAHLLRSEALPDRLIVRRNLSEKMWGRRIIKAVKKDCEPDLIHVQSTTFIYPRMFDTFPLFMGKTPLVVTTHDVPRYRQFHMLPFLRLIYRKAAVIIVLSNHVANELEQYHGRKIREKAVVMHHGIDLEKFSPNVSPRPFYNWLKIEPATFTIMFFGFLGQGKGIELALRAFKVFLAKHQAIARNSFRLIIAGSPQNGDLTYVNYLKSLAGELQVKDEIVMTGYVPYEIVPSALASADLLVYPYLGVSQSGPVHRSIAAGRPVVVSDLPAFKEIITDGKNGLVAKKNDAYSIADSFERLYLNESLRLRIGASARKYAEQHLDWREISRDTIEIYKSVLNTKSSVLK